jgi:hypothetical protein
MVPAELIPVLELFSEVGDVEREAAGVTDRHVVRKQLGTGAGRRQGDEEY